MSKFGAGLESGQCNECICTRSCATRGFAPLVTLASDHLINGEKGLKLLNSFRSVGMPVTLLSTTHLISSKRGCGGPPNCSRAVKLPALFLSTNQLISGEKGCIFPFS